MVPNDFRAGNHHGNTARVNPSGSNRLGNGDAFILRRSKTCGCWKMPSLLSSPTRCVFGGYGTLFSGVLAFDYGAGTVRFGTNLDPAEARQIVALLKERFGQYMADGKVEASS